MAKIARQDLKTKQAKRYPLPVDGELTRARVEKTPNGVRISFEVPGIPPTQNVLNQMHWTEKMKMKNDWKDIISLITSQAIPATPFKRARLTLTRFSTRIPDSDGLVGSFKHVIDSLVNLKILEDDSYAHVGMPTYLWEKITLKNQKIRVEIQEVRDGQA